MDESISRSFSKDSVYESMSFVQATEEDAALRDQVALANEEIQKGSKLLDTYTVLTDAISGGMGSVWQVRHGVWNMDIAAKRPKPAFFAAGSDRRKQEFIGECEHWIDLGLHPNIISCFYVREIGGVPSVFSEWMDGGSLKDSIRSGSLYEGSDEAVRQRLLDIAIQTIRGLSYSCERGLLHQDVKPGNILLSKEWDAKIGDFGLARAVSDEAEGSGSSGYTREYCPQEQIDGAEPAAWMDIYAWALTVIEMYAGERIWETGAEAAGHCDEYFEKCRYTMPEKLKTIISAALKSKDADYSQIESELRDAYREEIGIEYPRPVPTASPDTPDSLNNKALSYIDLGRRVEEPSCEWEMAHERIEEKYLEAAEACWDRAVERDPYHHISIFNRKLCELKYQIYNFGDFPRDVRDFCVDIGRLGGIRSAETYCMIAEAYLATYADDMPIASYDRALTMTEDAGLTESIQKRKAQIEKGYFRLPIDPFYCGKILFDVHDGKIAVTYHYVEETEDDYIDKSVLVLYDAETHEELARKDFERNYSNYICFLEGKIVIIDWDNEAICFDAKTLDGPTPMDADDIPEHIREKLDGERVLSDGRRRLISDQSERWYQNRDNTARNVGSAGAATIGIDLSESDMGLEAEHPSVGFSGADDVETLAIDSSGRYMLVYTRPYFIDNKDYFCMFDTELYGVLPAFRLSTAKNAQAMQKLQEKRAQLMETAAGEDTAAALTAIEELYELYEGHPDAEWVELNNAMAGHCSKVGVYGLRNREVTDEYVREIPGYYYEKEHIDYMSCMREFDLIGRNRYEIADGEFNFSGISENARAAYDRGAGIVYTAECGVLVAWDVSLSPATPVKMIRFGRMIPQDPWFKDGRYINTLEGFDPDKDAEWEIAAEYILLNREENATIAVVKGTVLNHCESTEDWVMANVYVDLEKGCVLSTDISADEGRAVFMKEGTRVFSECCIVDISDDGGTFLIDGSLQGSFMKVRAGDELVNMHDIRGLPKCIRPDGCACLGWVGGSRDEDTFIETTIDWKYGVAAVETEAAVADNTAVELEKYYNEVKAMQNEIEKLPMLSEERWGAIGTTYKGCCEQV